MPHLISQVSDSPGEGGTAAPLEIWIMSASAEDACAGGARKLDRAAKGHLGRICRIA